MPKTQIDYSGVFAKAVAAAKEASEAKAKEWFNGNDGGACGFAWCVVRPATGPFISWCKKQAKAAEAAGNRAHQYGDKNWNGGWCFWNPSGWPGQSIDVKEAGAVAFRNVIAMELGLNVEVGSRLD